MYVFFYVYSIHMYTKFNMSVTAGLRQGYYNVAIFILPEE